MQRERCGATTLKHTAYIISATTLLAATALFLLWERNPLIAPVTLNVSQNIHDYINPATADAPLLSAEQQAAQAQVYLQQFFNPWQVNGGFTATEFAARQQNILDAQNTFITHLLNQPPWGLNYQRVSRASIQQLVDDVDLAHYPNHSARAIIVHTTDARLLPYAQPMFYDYREAGQGFPFDLLQSSSLWVGEPVQVIHLSRDGLWALITTPRFQIPTWIPMRNLAEVDQDFIEQYQTGYYAGITDDHASFRDASGKARALGRIGMLLPVRHNTLLLPVADRHQQAVIIEIQLMAHQYEAFPWTITERHIAQLVDELIGQPYGWAGLFGYRDCSLMIKDLYTPFGIWLPRDSKNQQVSGRYTDVAELNNRQKMQQIGKATPFTTLLGKPGHVALYIGRKNDTAMILQDVWGIHTRNIFGKDGRAIIGKIAITPVTFGKEIRHGHNFLDSITHITYVAQPAVDGP